MFNLNENERAMDDSIKQCQELRGHLIEAKKEIVQMYYKYIRIMMEEEFEYQLTELKKKFKDNPEDVSTELAYLKVICENYNLKDIMPVVERAITLSYGYI